MDLKRALTTYTVLTIGDGLVTVIPALMVSVSGGLIVTRTSSDGKVGADVKQADLQQSAAADAFGRRPGRDGGVSGAADASFPIARLAAWGMRDGGCAKNSPPPRMRRRSSRRPRRRKTIWKRCSKLNRWRSKWAWGWSSWWKAGRTRRCCAASRESGGRWPRDLGLHGAAGPRHRQSAAQGGRIRGAAQRRGNRALRADAEPRAGDSSRARQRARSRSKACRRASRPSEFQALWIPSETADHARVQRLHGGRRA